FPSSPSPATTIATTSIARSARAPRMCSPSPAIPRRSSMKPARYWPAVCDNTPAEVSVGLLLAIVIALMILSLPTWPYAAGLGYGYYPSGGLGILLLIVIVLLLTRRRV